MARGDFSDLVAFLAVARTGSFTRAAKQLGISQPALSKSLKDLETRLGVRLLNRTTRSVTTTDAGDHLVESIAPHFEGIEAGLSALTDLRDKPSGTVRITTGDHHADTILVPAMAKLTKTHPDLNIEISVNTGFVDIVAERFDVGIRLGETLAQDMIAVRISPEMRMAVVAAPSYFKDRKAPKTPHDLAKHNCINLRLPSHGGTTVWEFDKRGHGVNVRVEGQMIVSTIALARSAALSGAGLAYLFEDDVERYIASGKLVRVLEDWCEPFPGYYLYYPSKRQQSPAIAAIIEALRYRES